MSFNIIQNTYNFLETPETNQSDGNNACLECYVYDSIRNKAIQSCYQNAYAQISLDILCIFTQQENTSNLIFLALQEVLWLCCCTGMEKDAQLIHYEPSSSHAKARLGRWNSGLYQGQLLLMLLKWFRLVGMQIFSGLSYL